MRNRFQVPVPHDAVPLGRLRARCRNARQTGDPCANCLMPGNRPMNEARRRPAASNAPPTQGAASRSTALQRPQETAGGAAAPTRDAAGKLVWRDSRPRSARESLRDVSPELARAPATAATPGPGVAAALVALRELGPALQTRQRRDAPVREHAARACPRLRYLISVLKLVMLAPWPPPQTSRPPMMAMRFFDLVM
jgi:hypothetical protein